MQHFDTPRQRRENQQGRRQPRRSDEWRAGDFSSNRRYDEPDRNPGNPQFDQYQQGEGRYAADEGWENQGRDYRYADRDSNDLSRQDARYSDRDWNNQGRQDLRYQEWQQQDYPNWQQQADRGNFGFHQGGQRFQDRELDRQREWRHSSFDRDSASNQRLYGGDDQGRFDRVDDMHYGRDSHPLRFGNGDAQQNGLSEGSYRGRGPKGYQRSKDQIIDEASQRLEWDPNVDASEIELKFENGILTLQGSVETREEKRRAEECVESVYGVKDVMNNLRIESQGRQSTGRTQQLQ